MTRTTKSIDIGEVLPDPGNERSETPDKEALARLADSVKQHGILQRLLVRPVNGKFMVVAGHRRLQAAKAAGLEAVPVEVRDIDEEEAKALQIIENLHREDVTPLDEAKAFDSLRGEDRSIEDIAALVGHNPRYVAQRLSLVNLVPEARKALAGRSIALGTAYLLARVQNAKVQREALRYVVTNADEPMSVARARSIIEQHFELNLAEAPFDPADTTLVPEAGACLACPKRAGNQPLLFDGADREARCTDPTCFRKKAKAAGRKHAEELRHAGHAIHGAKAAQEKFFDRGYRGFQLKGSWISLDEPASYATNQTWGKILKTELEQEKNGTYVVHPETGTVLRVFSRSRALKIAREAGHEWAGARSKREKSAKEKKADREQHIRRLTEGHVTEALLARLDDVDLEKHVDWLADAILDAARSDSLRHACQALGLKQEQEVETPYGKHTETWKDRLVRATRGGEISSRRVFLLALMQEQGWHYRASGSQPSLRERLLAELGIDAEAVEKKVRADLRKGS